MDSNLKLAKIKDRADLRKDVVGIADQGTKVLMTLAVNPVFSVLAGYVLTEIAAATVYKHEDTWAVDTDGSITGTVGEKYIQRKNYTLLSQNGASDVKSCIVGGALLGAFGNLGAGLLSALTGGK